MISAVKKIKHFVAHFCKEAVMLIDCLIIRVFDYEYVLLHAPDHGNLGDQAIALAEHRFFKKNKMKIFEVGAWTFDSCDEMFSKLIPKNRVIVIHGGGFLGSIWPREEMKFRRILELFPDNRIICFPQTVTFFMNNESDKSFFEESKRIYSKRKNFTLFLRDQKSFEFVSDNFPDVKAKLVPDIVMSLHYDNNSIKRAGIRFCLRRDVEKALTKNEEDKLCCIVKKQYPNEEIFYTDTVINRRMSVWNRNKALNDKLKEFESSKLIVTDRLHGMIFSAITSTPCIAMNNQNCKVQNLYSWISNNKYIVFANDVDSFEQTLSKLDITSKYRYSFDLAQFKELVKELKNARRKQRNKK